MNSLRLTKVCLFLLCAGCGAGALPQRYPSRPPAGMTATQAGQDENACVAVAAELEECRRFGYAAGRSDGGTRDMIVDRMEAAFRNCLDPRGYVVQRQAEPTTTRPRR